VQDCLRHCHELIEATVRDSVSCSDELATAPTTASDNHNHNHNDDDDNTADRQSGAVDQPTTPTDVRDISLVNADEPPSSGLL